MRVARFYQSMRFKVKAGLFCLLLVILSSLSYQRYSYTRGLMIANLRNSAESSGELIQSALRHAMSTNDLAAVQLIVSDIAKQPDLQDIVLMDKEGRVVIASAPEAIGTVTDIGDPTCQVCHQEDATARNGSVVVTSPQNGRILRNANAVENTAECWSCHDPRDKLTGVLLTDFSMQSVDRQLAAVRNSSILWSGLFLLVTMLAAELLMSRLVLDPLEKFLAAIRQISSGNLAQRIPINSSDEIGQLAEVFNGMAVGLQERARLAESVRQRTEDLQAQTAKLEALNTIASTVSQSLDLHQVLESALANVLSLLRWKAGWIVLRNVQTGEFEMSASRGLPEQVAAAHVGCTSSRGVCSDVIATGQAKLLDHLFDDSCPAASYLVEGGLAFRACVPLRAKNHVRGVMSLFADTASGATPLTEDTVQLLEAIGAQIGMALENATLYQELSDKEEVRKQLLARMLSAQEEERKRISRELHDETSQALTSLLVKLRVLEEACVRDDLHPHLEDLRAEVARTLERVHDLALGLRPAVLDDLGLVAALRQHLKSYQVKFGIIADLQVLGLDEQRLPSDVETALYHIVQEALINVARHAQARSVSVLLQHRGGSVIAIVEDDGVGFDVSQVLGSRPRKSNLGLYGMHERAALLDGAVTIESTPGTGTSVFAEIPLQRKEARDEQDSLASRR